jgi:uridine nucleosidase
LTGITGHEIPFYEFDPRIDGPHRRERFDVTVLTDGSYEEAKAGAQTGRTVVRALESDKPGVRIPRGLDIPLFWSVLEECCQRADEANARNGSILD